MFLLAIPVVLIHRKDNPSDPLPSTDQARSWALCANVSLQMQTGYPKGVQIIRNCLVKCGLLLAPLLGELSAPAD